MPQGFNMKGVAYLGLREYIAAAVPGGLAAVSERLPEDLRAFLGQPFASGSWYDVSPLPRIATAAAGLKGTSYLSFMRAYGAAQVDRDANGIYRLLLKLVSPDTLVAALPKTAKRYFDFVVSEVRRVEPRHYAVELSGIPEALGETYSMVTEVFIERALSGAGAKGVRVTTSAARRGDLVNGAATVRFSRTIRWDLE